MPPNKPCHVWQTCLRVVWACAGSCLHRACRRSRGKQVLHLERQRLIPSRGTEDKRLRNCRGVAGICSQEFCSPELLPLAVSLKPALQHLALPLSTRINTTHTTSVTHNIPLIEHHESTRLTNSPTTPSLFRRQRPQCASTSTPTTCNAPPTSHCTPTSAPRTSPTTSRASYSARITGLSASTPTNFARSARRRTKLSLHLAAVSSVPVRRRIRARRAL